MGTLSPPKAVILAIGRELLTGRVLDRNSNFLCARLFELGWSVVRVCVVDDAFRAVCNPLRQALAESVDLVVTTGGLGPTYDDGTLGYVGRCLGRKVRLDPRAESMVIQRYEDVAKQGVIAGGNLNRARMKMAFLPEGATPLPNAVGTAPGAWFDDPRVACLPGPPREMQAMFESSVVSKIAPLTDGRVFMRDRVTLAQPDESVLDPLIAKARAAFPEVYFKTTPHGFTDPMMDVIVETYGPPQDARQRLKDAIAFVLGLFQQN